MSETIVKSELRKLMGTVLALGAFAGASVDIAQAQAAAPLDWLLAPSFYPKGAKIAVVSGNPNNPAPFEVQLIFPDGYRMDPHFHSTDLHVKVLEGQLLVGIGNKQDWKRTQAANAGDTATVPAHAAYYYRAKGRTTISASAVGPFTLDYVNRLDDPSQPPALRYR